MRVILKVRLRGDKDQVLSRHFRSTLPNLCHSLLYLIAAPHVRSSVCSSLGSTRITLPFYWLEARKSYDARRVSGDVSQQCTDRNVCDHVITKRTSLPIDARTSRISTRAYAAGHRVVACWGLDDWTNHQIIR